MTISLNGYGYGCKGEISFRLNNSSFTNEGVGDVTSLPTWVRLSRNPGSNYNLDFYSGMVFGGMMSIDDTNGSRLSSDHHQPLHSWL
jgi:hypothetical protein